MLSEDFTSRIQNFNQLILRLPYSMVTIIELSCIITLIVLIYLIHTFSYWKRNSFPELKFSRLRSSWTKIHLHAVVNKLHQLSKNRPFVGIYYFCRPMLLINDYRIAREILESEKFQDDHTKLKRMLNTWFAFQYINDLEDEELWVTVFSVLCAQSTDDVRKRKEFELLAEMPTWGRITKWIWSRRMEEFVLDILVNARQNSFIYIFVKHHLSPIHQSAELRACAVKFVDFFCNLYLELTHSIELNLKCLTNGGRRAKFLNEINRYDQEVFVSVSVERYEIVGSNLLIPKGVEIVIPIKEITRNQPNCTHKSSTDDLRPTFVDEITKLVIKNKR